MNHRHQHRPLLDWSDVTEFELALRVSFGRVLVQLGAIASKRLGNLSNNSEAGHLIIDEKPTVDAVLLHLDNRDK